MTMAKRDLPRMSWSFLAFVTGLIFVTLSSAEDPMTICRRIQNNVLKIRTMGLVGDELIVLTAEGDLFYLSKANLRGSGTSSPTLTIDQVPVRANRVLGVELDYKIRSGYLFFLLVDIESKSELLMTLQVESEKVRLQAFLLDWKKTRKGQKSDWTEKRFKPNESDFKPHFMTNEDSANCAQAITIFLIRLQNTPGLTKSRFLQTQKICLNGDSLDVKWYKKNFNPFIKLTDDDSPILTGFHVQEPKDGQRTEFVLFSDGMLKHLSSKIKSWKICQLSNFIQCGPNFTDATSRWEPAQVNRSSNVTGNQTQISGWTIVTVILVGLSIGLVIMMILLLKKKKREAKKRNRKDKHPNLGSSALSAIGSSTVGSSNAFSGGSSACASSFESNGASLAISTASPSSNVSSGTSSDINLGSSASSAIVSSKVSSSNVSPGGSSTLSSPKATSGMSPALTSSNSSRAHCSSPVAKSKLRSLIDRVFSAFKKNQKNNAEQLSKARKAKENKKKDGSKK